MSLQDDTKTAESALSVACHAIRQAHDATRSFDQPDAMTILLVDVIEESAALHLRLRLIAELAAGPSYVESEKRHANAIR